MLNAFIIQLIGFVAWLFLLASYWKKKVNDVILFQMFSCLLFGIHYYFLGAMSGLYIVIFEVIRDFIYYKSKYDKYVFIGSLPICFIIGIFNYDGFLSIFSALASVIDGFSLTQKKRNLVLGSIVSEIFWFIYDMFCLSYVGMFANFCLIVSNCIVLWKQRKEV